MIYYEAKDFPPDGLEATGEDVTVTVPVGTPSRAYKLFGHRYGSMLVARAMVTAMPIAWTLAKAMLVARALATAMPIAVVKATAMPTLMELRDE